MAESRRSFGKKLLMAPAGALGSLRAERAAPAGPVLRTELDPAYYAWVAAPGELLSVLDNITDFEECRRRVSANAANTGGGPRRIYNPATREFDLDFGQTAKRAEQFIEQKIRVTVGLGDHNNPWFPWHPPEFWERYPDGRMSAADGKPIFLKHPEIGGGREIPMPAVDDPARLRLASRIIRGGVDLLKANPWVTSWVIGSEEGYPEYFGFPMCDFRPASWKHFQEWLALTGKAGTPDRAAITAKSWSGWKAAWFKFREQAMADRAAHHMLDFLATDVSRPVFYPTHGTIYHGETRWRLGQPPSTMAPACDGLELGHILVMSDDERRNPIMLAHFASFGTAIIVPRLGNRTLDVTAKGLGRSFTPAMLRRLVYECLGHGVWHIGPIHWRAVLHDGEWFIKGTAAERECAAVFREIHEARPVLEGMARLQPQVGLFAADDTWLESWNPRCTAFFQDCLAAHWNVTIAGDTHLSAEFARRVPVLVSIDNPRLSAAALAGMKEYLAAGGRLVVWGSFAEFDEDAAPREAAAVQGLLGLEGVVRVDAPADSAKRSVLSQTLTSREGSGGANNYLREFYPAPFAPIAAAVRKIAPQAVPCPAGITSAGGASRVNVYTLTDRSSLLFVVVNNAGEPAAVTLKPDPALLRGAPRWVFFDVTRKQAIPGTSACSLELPAHGSAMVWVHPAVDRKQARAARDRALRALAGWKRRGCDTAYLERHRRFLETPPGDAVAEAKAYCLAEAVLRSLCLKTALRQPPEGGLDVEATPFDSAMRPVKQARVTLRFVPDRFRRLALDASGGAFVHRLPPGELPLIYDMDGQRYRQAAGRVRVVFHAESAGAAGGSMAVVDLAQAGGERS